MKRLPVASSLFLLSWSVLAQEPVAVSPGGDGEVSEVEARCPTFSWGTVEGAGSYELIVYRLEEPGGPGEPMLRHEVHAAASSWTPSLESCLEAGTHYAWSVRATSGKGATHWSEPALFRVAPKPTEEEFRRALAVVERYLVDSQPAPLTRDGPGEQPVGSPAAEARFPTTEVPSRMATRGAALETGSLTVDGTIVANSVQQQCIGSFANFETRRFSGNGHCYTAAIFDSGTPTWEGAKLFCGFGGSYLATVTYSAEETWVRGLFGAQSNAGELSHAWIGYSDAPSEGSWEWINGELAVTANDSTYANWAPGEPNNAGPGEDCAELVPVGWNDENCATGRSQLVCERDW